MAYRPHPYGLLDLTQVAACGYTEKNLFSAKEEGTPSGKMFFFEPANPALDGLEPMQCKQVLLLSLRGLAPTDALTKLCLLSVECTNAIDGVDIRAAEVVNVDEKMVKLQERPTVFVIAVERCDLIISDAHAGGEAAEEIDKRPFDLRMAIIDRRIDQNRFAGRCEKIAAPEIAVDQARCMRHPR
jgi:hypothetical protein